MERFWPLETFRSRVWVVLDAENPADQASQSAAPAQVTERMRTNFGKNSALPEACTYCTT